MIADLHILRGVAQHLSQRFIGFGLDHFGNLLVGLSQQGRIVLRGELSVIYVSYVPEPSTYAAIFGALALAAAVFRRRK